MKCPHCLVKFHDSIDIFKLGEDVEGFYAIHSQKCPSCFKFVLYLEQYHYEHSIKRVDKLNLIRPKIANRAPCPLEVPAKFAIDYTEACLVLEDSPKASAALSRRCLQSIIHDKLGINKRDLFQEIQAVIDQHLFPSDILDSIDSIRTIGNFAAHPLKSTSSGEIVEVEPSEAEWNLDVLEMMFDFLFVRPALVQKKREALNARLNDMGKPDMQ